MKRKTKKISSPRLLLHLIFLSVVTLVSVIIHCSVLTSALPAPGGVKAKTEGEKRKESDSDKGPVLSAVQSRNTATVAYASGSRVMNQMTGARKMDLVEVLVEGEMGESVRGKKRNKKTHNGKYDDNDDISELLGEGKLSDIPGEHSGTMRTVYENVAMVRIERNLKDEDNVVHRETKKKRGGGGGEEEEGEDYETESEEETKSISHVNEKEKLSPLLGEEKEVEVFGTASSRLIDVARPGGKVGGAVITSAVDHLTPDTAGSAQGELKRRWEAESQEVRQYLTRNVVFELGDVAAERIIPRGASSSSQGDSLGYTKSLFMYERCIKSACHKLVGNPQFGRLPLFMDPYVCVRVKRSALKAAKKKEDPTPVPKHKTEQKHQSFFQNLVSKAKSLFTHHQVNSTDAKNSSSSSSSAGNVSRRDNAPGGTKLHTEKERLQAEGEARPNDNVSIVEEHSDTNNNDKDDNDEQEEELDEDGLILKAYCFWSPGYDTQQEVITAIHSGDLKSSVPKADAYDGDSFNIPVIKQIKDECNDASQLNPLDGHSKCVFCESVFDADSEILTHRCLQKSSSRSKEQQAERILFQPYKLPPKKEVPVDDEVDTSAVDVEEESIASHQGTSVVTPPQSENYAAQGKVYLCPGAPEIPGINAKMLMRERNAKAKTHAKLLKIRIAVNFVVDHYVQEMVKQKIVVDGQEVLKHRLDLEFQDWIDHTNMAFRDVKYPESNARIELYIPNPNDWKILPKSTTDKWLLMDAYSTSREKGYLQDHAIFASAEDHKFGATVVVMKFRSGIDRYVGMADQIGGICSGKDDLHHRSNRMMIAIWEGSLNRKFFEHTFSHEFGHVMGAHHDMLRHMPFRRYHEDAAIRAECKLTEWYGGKSDEERLKFFMMNYNAAETAQRGTPSDMYSLCSRTTISAAMSGNVYTKCDGTIPEWSDKGECPLLGVFQYEQMHNDESPAYAGKSVLTTGKQTSIKFVNNIDNSVINVTAQGHELKPSQPSVLSNKGSVLSLSTSSSSSSSVSSGFHPNIPSLLRKSVDTTWNVKQMATVYAFRRPPSSIGGGKQDQKDEMEMTVQTVEAPVQCNFGLTMDVKRGTGDDWARGDKGVEDFRIFAEGGRYTWTDAPGLKRFKTKCVANLNEAFSPEDCGQVKVTGVKAGRDGLKPLEVTAQVDWEKGLPDAIGSRILLAMKAADDEQEEGASGKSDESSDGKNDSSRDEDKTENSGEYVDLLYPSVTRYTSSVEELGPDVWSMMRGQGMPISSWETRVLMRHSYIGHPSMQAKPAASTSSVTSNDDDGDDDYDQDVDNKKNNRGKRGDVKGRVADVKVTAQCEGLDALSRELGSAFTKNRNTNTNNGMDHNGEEEEDDDDDNDDAVVVHMVYQLEISKEPERGRIRENKEEMNREGGESSSSSSASSPKVYGVRISKSLMSSKVEAPFDEQEHEFELELKLCGEGRGEEGHCVEWDNAKEEG
eukprot:Nk52_evm11s216 gene=Nk52_evmTU11s216